MARRLTARSSPAWVGDLPVFERTLPNGLKALVLPRRHAPVVVCDLYYPVGSFDEPVGKTGLAHFVEHMLFKGTDRFPKGQIDRLAFVAAGQSNAETGEDTTHYWFAFPSDRWELALAVESDRMRGASFDPREVEAERQVIAEERARDHESPFSRLDQAHLTTSYVRHPYRNPILGWPDDLERITTADLKSFYREHYRPDGAVLVIVGDVDPDRALDGFRGPVRPARDPAALPSQNDLRGAQAGRPPRLPARRVRVDRPRAAGLAHRPPGACRRTGARCPLRPHDLRPALTPLGRLGRARQAGDLRRDRPGGSPAGRPVPGAGRGRPRRRPRADRAGHRPDHRPACRRGADPNELERSRNRLEAAWRWEQEDLAGLAAGLGQFALNGDWRAWQAEHRAALGVQAEDVRRVASTYLTEGNLTVGWSVPRPSRAITVLLPVEARVKEARPATPKTPSGRSPSRSPAGRLDWRITHPERRRSPTACGS